MQDGRFDGNEGGGVEALYFCVPLFFFAKICYTIKCALMVIYGTRTDVRRLENEYL